MHDTMHHLTWIEAGMHSTPAAAAAGANQSGLWCCPTCGLQVFEYMTGVVASVQQAVAAHPPPPQQAPPSSSSGKASAGQQAAEAPLLAELKKTILQVRQPSLGSLT